MDLALGTEKEARGKKIAFAVIFVLLWLAMGGYARAGWVGNAWGDLKANSKNNLGSNLAFGCIQDFVYGRSYTGFKTSVYSYRELHLEYGAMLRIYKGKPIASGIVNHTLGISIYVQPFLRWAYIPKKYVLIKNLYIGPVVGYNLHRWTAGLQIHLPFADLDHDDDEPESDDRSDLPDDVAAPTVSKPARNPMWGNVWGHK